MACFVWHTLRRYVADGLGHTLELAFFIVFPPPDAWLRVLAVAVQMQTGTIRVQVRGWADPRLAGALCAPQPVMRSGTSRNEYKVLLSSRITG
jgi:hypothetical protein